jgi:hypothetical protein
MAHHHLEDKHVRSVRHYLALALLGVGLILPALVEAQARKQKQPSKGTEAAYYKLLTFKVPPGEVLEAGAIEILPGDRIAVGTRRGEVWIIDNAYDPDPEKVKFSRFAHGLHEVLGLAYKDGWLYVTQRPDVTRIKDTDGDGKADLFEVVTDGWEINGDYHEYAFGSTVSAGTRSPKRNTWGRPPLCRRPTAES